MSQLENLCHPNSPFTAVDHIQLDNLTNLNVRFSEFVIHLTISMHKKSQLIVVC